MLIIIYNGPYHPVYLAMRNTDCSPGGPEGEVTGRTGASIARSARASSSRMIVLTSVALAAAEVRREEP